MRHNASLLKRFVACVYELLLLVAIWLVLVALFLLVMGEVDTHHQRFFLQSLLWLVTGAYFVWCWHKTGQTLAAQTWKLKLVNAENAPLSVKQALQRYVLASASLMLFGLGFLWALIDKEQLFLHDRLLKTRFILLA
ncbi:MAG: RDD family protein [Methylophilaceae bacterium]